MKYTNENGTNILTTNNYNPHQYELEHIIKGIQTGDTKDFDIESIYDSAAIAFECRSMMK